MQIQNLRKTTITKIVIKAKGTYFVSARNARTAALRVGLRGQCAEAARRLAWKHKRELEYRIPRLHYPVNSLRFLDLFGDF